MLHYDPTIRMRKTNYQSPPLSKPIAPRAGSYLAYLAYAFASWRKVRRTHPRTPAR